MDIFQKIICILFLWSIHLQGKFSVWRSSNFKAYLSMTEFVNFVIILVLRFRCFDFGLCSIVMHGDDLFQLYRF